MIAATPYHPGLMLVAVAVTGCMIFIFWVIADYLLLWGIQLMWDGEHFSFQWRDATFAGAQFDDHYDGIELPYDPVNDDEIVDAEIFNSSGGDDPTFLEMIPSES